jgi:formylglycine-generating enzyme required for sulfatase activity
MKKTMRNRAMIGMVIMSLVVSAAVAQSAQQSQEAMLKTQMRGVWTDPSTKLTWAAKDNGKDVSYKDAMNYCRDLHLAGHSEWRLATMAELQGIYDESAWTPGLAGDEISDTWHVKGNLFLTGYQWAYGAHDQSGRTEGDQFFLDFNDGRSYSEAILHSSVCMRALCVRDSGK